MQTQIRLENIAKATCVVKDTNKQKGRTITVKPGETASRNLFYGRIIIEAGDAPIAFETDGHETGLICLNGSGHVTTGGQTFAMSRYDALYVPRDSKVIAASEAPYIQLRVGKGCPKCSGTGYKGRIALYEVMPMYEGIREFILNGASTAEIKREAAKLGMMTLRQSGLMRIKEGVTTIEEVLRVTAPD